VLVARLAGDGERLFGPLLRMGHVDGRHRRVVDQGQLGAGLALASPVSQGPCHHEHLKTHQNEVDRVEDGDDIEQIPSPYATTRTWRSGFKIDDPEPSHCLPRLVPFPQLSRKTT
jgi:hypothetical protein